MFFWTLRRIAVFVTRQFFREIRLRGEPVQEGSLLIVANHPSVVLDGLLVVTAYPRKIWFLAKSTIFKGAHVNWLLSLLHLIPVKRRVDYVGKQIDNREVFRVVTDRLLDGSAVVIFPEGQSMAARRITQVKTGAARIALQAAEEANFDGRIRIQAAGITYADFYRFNNSVTVTLGEPINIIDFKEDYERDQAEAVKRLTEEIGKELGKVTATVISDEHAPLVEKIAKVYKSRGNQADDFERLKGTAEAVELGLKAFPKEVAQLEKQLTLYFRLSSSLNIDGSEDLSSKTAYSGMLFLAPLILFGLLMHYLPFQLSVWITKMAAKHRSQTLSWGLSSGFGVFLIWYALVFLGALSYTGTIVMALLFLLTVILSGYLTVKYLNTFVLFVLATFWPGHRSPLEVLRSVRDDLYVQLEALRERLGEAGSLEVDSLEATRVKVDTKNL